MNTLVLCNTLSYERPFTFRDRYRIYDNYLVHVLKSKENCDIFLVPGFWFSVTSISAISHRVLLQNHGVV